MFKLAGALLNKPEVLKRAAQMSNASPLIKGAARIAADGGSELLKASIPGSIVTAGLGALTTGNPLAGFAIGAADLGLSYGGARAISKYAPQMAGKYRYYVDPAQAETAVKTGVPVDPSQLLKSYEPSTLQSTAMLAGSIAAPVVLEPMFLQAQQQQAINQNITQQQQLAQQEYINQLTYTPYTADGTLYQLQGLPQRVV